MGQHVYLLSLLLQLFSVSSYGKEINFTSFDLSFVNVMHSAYCILSKLCVTPEFLPPPLSIININGSFVTPPLEAIPFPSPSPPPINDGSCCGSCSCDLDRCTLSGTCCPNTLDYLPSVQESSSKIKMECNYASFKKSILPRAPSGLTVWMFRKCTKNFQGDDLIRQKCENPEKFPEWETQVPVRDNNDIDYQNIFCATCNNILKENTVYWIPSVQCATSVLIPSSMDTVFDEVSKVSDCNIIYNLPDKDMTLPECDIINVSQCNVTGLWKRYDPVIEAACHAYTAIFYFEYNNLFCYLCNELEENLPGICSKDEGGNIVFSFSALLKFTPSNIQLGSPNDKPQECTGTQILDSLNNKCHTLFCIPPKALQDDICNDTVEYLTGVHYEAFLKLTPYKMDARVLDLNKTIFDVWNIYRDYFRSLHVSDLVYEQTLYYKKVVNNGSYIECFVLHCKTLFGVYDKLSNVFVNGLLALEKNPDIFVTNNSSNPQGFKMTLTYYDITEKRFTDNSSSTPEASLVSVHVVPFFANGILPSFVDNTPPILVTKLLGCPLIELSSEEYEFKVFYKSGIKCVYFEEFNTTLGPDCYMLTNRSNKLSIRICSDDFISMTQTHQQNSTTSRPVSSLEVGVTPQGILSLICTCISLLCLILTLATYSLCKELRTQPGINIMALVICLIIAQALYQFGGNQAASVSKRSCKTIGILIHFSWLMVMFWMNVCCFHMFRVFSSITVTSASTNCFKQTVIYTVYTFVASIIFVTINIIVSLSSPEFEGMGYGGTLCYITDHRMVGYVFALPVACVITLNLISFILVTIKILRMPTVNSDTKHSRNYFAIFAKLSTITGITWIFGFIHFFTAAEALEYIFIIFNASQGVFIFLSFVFNKRVLDMYQNKIRELKSEEPDSSTLRKKSVDTALTDIATKK